VRRRAAALRESRSAESCGLLVGWVTATQPEPTLPEGKQAPRRESGHDPRTVRTQSERCSPCSRSCVALLLEVDPHDHPPDGGVADLSKPGVLEDLAGPNVHLTPGDLLAWLGDHLIGLERAGAALPGEVDRGFGEGIGETSAAVALPDCEAGHRPDAVVVLVLIPAAPRDPGGAQLRVGRARFDCDPARWLAVDINHEPAGGRGARIAAGR